MTKDIATIDDTTVDSVAMDDRDFLLRLVERALQRFLEVEMTAHLGADRYERSDARRGYRNGFKPRQLHTRVGTLNLHVPQDRDGTFSTQLFARYQRSEKALVLALMEMYVEGVSTRKVTEVTEALCGTTFSKSQVSELARGLCMEQSEEWVCGRRYLDMSALSVVIQTDILLRSSIPDGQSSGAGRRSGPSSTAEWMP